MKKAAAVILLGLALSLACSQPALAHLRGGIWIAPPFLPVFLLSGPVATGGDAAEDRQEGGDYLQQPEAQQYWYYCSEPQGYYPYVKECPKGWKKVEPAPAPPEREEEEDGSGN